MRYLNKTRKGAALSILAFVTLMSIFAGFALFNQSVRELQLEETRQIMRDIGEVINAIHSHYSYFIDIAGEYVDAYDESSPANMNDVVNAWGGQGLFDVPVGQESFESINNRLQLENHLSNEPFQGKFVEEVYFESEVQSFITSPVGISMIPNRWTVTMTVKSKGSGRYAVGLLRDRAAKENGFLSPLHKNQYISVNVLKMEKDEIIIQLDCRLVSKTSATFKSYEF